jgi:hypothetical protein
MFETAVLKGGKSAFVHFWKPNDNYLKLKHIWDKLGRFYYKSDFIIGDVDCSDPKGQEFCEKRGITMYPTLIYWQNGMATMDQGFEYPYTQDILQNKSAAYPTLKIFAYVHMREIPDECNFYTLAKCAEEETAMVKELPVDQELLKRTMGGYRRDRLKMDKLHRVKVKQRNDEHKAALSQKNHRASLEEDHRREMKEFVQQYRVDRHKLQRKIRLLNNLYAKVGIDSLVAEMKYRDGRLKYTEEQRKYFESHEYAQHVEMHLPRTFVKDYGEDWVQTHGPRAEDFAHLPHSPFKSPYVFDPNRPKQEGFRDVLLDAEEAWSEIQSMEDVEDWHEDL